MPGYLYVLSNPSMPELYKVGRTDRDIRERIAELSSTTGVPSSFALELFMLVLDSDSAEQRCHEALARYRVSDNREFFKLDREVAWPTLLQTFAELGAEAMLALDEGVLRRALEIVKERRPAVYFGEGQRKGPSGTVAKREYPYLTSMPTEHAIRAIEEAFQFNPEIWRAFR